MKVILLYVSTLDGKVTKWGQKNIHLWTSPEDIKYFRDTINKSKVLVMGSGTYNAVQPKPQKGIVRIVLTHNPELYKKYEVRGQLEFIDEQPEQLVQRLQLQGYKEMLLVSGKTLSTAFLKKKLIDELWLTLEPKVFGNGDSLTIDEKLDISLQLKSQKKLNHQGTLLLKYSITQ